MKPNYKTIIITSIIWLILIFCLRPFFQSPKVTNEGSEFELMQDSLFNKLENLEASTSRAEAINYSLGLKIDRYDEKIYRSERIIDSLKNENENLRQIRINLSADIDSLSLDEAIRRMSDYYQRKGISTSR